MNMFSDLIREGKMSVFKNMMQSKSSTLHLKMVFIGSSGAGKTCMVQRLKNKRVSGNQSCTIGGKKDIV